MSKPKVTLFWFRRDLRLDDNLGLFHALKSEFPVIILFIFDDEILESLHKNDARVSFIYDSLSNINSKLNEIGSSILIKKGTTNQVWESITTKFDVQEVHYNKDYEPYAIKRDAKTSEFLQSKSIKSYGYKDQVIFEEKEITKSDGLPYTVFTPFKNKWLEKFNSIRPLTEYDTSILFSNLYKSNFTFPKLSEIGFEESAIKVVPHNLSKISNYHETRDFPAIDATSYLSPHLRFGTVSIRKLVQKALFLNEKWLNELIWRDFYMNILHHFPHISEGKSFKKQYDNIVWRNNETEFEKWCEGKTGYPIVDAGMRELNETGFMHNRVRMITASFLVKHLHHLKQKNF